MDNQAEPVAQLAEEAGGAGPKLDTTARKPAKGKPEPEIKIKPDVDKKPATDARERTGAESGSAASSSSASGSGQPASPSGTVQPPAASKVSASSDTKPFTRPVNIGKADSVPQPDAAQSAATDKADAAGEAGAVKPDLSKSDLSKPDLSKPGNGAKPQTTAELAAAAIERELKKAGFTSSASEQKTGATSSAAASAGTASAGTASAGAASSGTASSGAAPGTAQAGASSASPASPVVGSASAASSAAGSATSLAGAASSSSGPSPAPSLAASPASAGASASGRAATGTGTTGTSATGASATGASAAGTATTGTGAPGKSATGKSATGGDGTGTGASPWSASASNSTWTPAGAGASGGTSAASAPAGSSAAGSSAAGSPSGASPWSPSGVRSAPPGAAAASGSSRSAYSSAAAPNTESVTDLATGLLAGTQIPDRVQPAKPQPGAAPSLRSSDLKSKVTAPFAAATKIKRPKPGAPARSGSAIGNGRAMSLKSRGAALRRPVAQPASQSARQSDTAARDAQLVLARIEPWSVMKFTFMLSLVGWAALFVVVAVCYFLLSALGVFHSIEHTVGLVTSSQGNPGSNAASWFSAATVLGFTLIAGAIDVIIITAMATVGAVIYNWVTRISGGIEVTLAEAD